MQRRDTQAQAGFALEEIGKVSAWRGFQAVFAQQFGEGFAAAGAFGEQQDTAGKAVNKGFQAGQRVCGTALDRDRRNRVRQPLSPRRRGKIRG